tara:strand:+ start:385 stop:588 length:204 start_codon:yes stop_codon:yes gene_type:complete
MKFDWLKAYTKRIFRRFRYGKSSMWFYQISQSSNNAEMYLFYTNEPPCLFLEKNIFKERNNLWKRNF